MRIMNKRLGKRWTMIIGIGFVLASSVLFWCIFYFRPVIKVEVTLILACILLGIGTSTTNICSFSLTSDLIGLNTECGAFVYGIMSFTDKLTNGILIAIVQQVNPCKTEQTEACALYYRQILTIIPVVASFLTILMTIMIWKSDIGGNRHELFENSTISKSQLQDSDDDERTPLTA